eukprot:757175-Hanusia_phi.AAC.1
MLRVGVEKAAVKSAMAREQSVVLLDNVFDFLSGHAVCAALASNFSAYVSSRLCMIIEISSSCIGAVLAIQFLSGFNKIIMSSTNSKPEFF